MIARDDYAFRQVLMEEAGDTWVGDFAEAGQAALNDTWVGDFAEAGQAALNDTWVGDFAEAGQAALNDTRAGELPKFQSSADLLDSWGGTFSSGFTENFMLNMSSSDIYTGVGLKLADDGKFTYSRSAVDSFITSVIGQTNNPKAGVYVQQQIQKAEQEGFLRAPTDKKDGEGSEKFLGLEAKDWVGASLALLSAGMAFYWNNEQMKLYRDQMEEGTRRWDAQRGDANSQFAQSLALKQQTVDQAAGGGAVIRGSSAKYR